jgi:hypothetical protein
LRPGGSVRLNPLDAPVGGDRDEVFRRRAELLASLASASLGRDILPTERTAVELAVDEVTDTRVPTLPGVVDALLAPTQRAAAVIRSDPTSLAADGRQVALELRRLVAGDLRGMFDGPTTSGVSLDGPLVVLDLSAVYHSAALGVLMTCATAWLQAGLGRQPHGVVVVVDEAWAILANLGVARWLQSSWKLSRARGVSNVAVLHRLSDLAAVGGAQSEQVGLAHGLLSDSETRELLGLSDTEAELIPHLQRGVGLWRVANRSFLVQHRLSPYEGALVDTDARMRHEHEAHDAAAMV